MFQFWLKSPLLEEAGDKAGGTGGGAGSGTADKSGTFDAAAFKTELLGDINKMVQGALKAQKNDFSKLLQQSGKGGSGDGSGDGAGGGDGSGDGAGAGSGSGSGDGKNKPDANTRQLETRLKSLETQLTTEKQAREEERTARRNAERDSLVSKALGEFRFADGDAGKDAFDLVVSKLKWAEDGALVGPDGETAADEWIKATITKKTHLLAPRESGGAGARGGHAAGANGVKALDLDDIKPGMKPEDLARAAAQIAQLLPGARQ